MKQDLLGDLKLCRDGRNTSIGGRALIPRKGSLKEAVELRKGERKPPAAEGHHPGSSV